MGSCNPAEPPPPVLNIAFSGRNSSDPALPIGFQDQLFATLRDGTVPLTTTFTWSSDTPTIASIDANGVVTALAEGSAVLRATAADGTTATWTLPTRTGSFSASASYVGNTEFGDPTDADAGDDFTIRRPQYTTSYSRARNIPNWVAYNLEQTHFGAEDRCDCFTYDPQLPPDFPRYTTADYTGAAAINGYSIDRGHLVEREERQGSAPVLNDPFPAHVFDGGRVDALDAFHQAQRDGKLLIRAVGKHQQGCFCLGRRGGITLFLGLPLLGLLGNLQGFEPR